MTAPNRRWFQFSICALVAGFVIALFIGLPLFIYLGVTSVTETVHDCYAVSWVSHSLIEYMKTHDGAWPDSWEELEASHDALTARAGEVVWPFDWLRDRVEVDFGVDPKKLIEASKTDGRLSFRVVRLRDGSSAHWQGDEPNQVILEYLRSEQDGEHRPSAP